MSAEDYLPPDWESTLASNWRNDEQMLPEHMSCQHTKREHHRGFDICKNCFRQLRPVKSAHAEEK